MPNRTEAGAYRERAEELCTIAQDFIGTDTQRMLVSLAMDYERMAAQIESDRQSSDDKT